MAQKNGTKMEPWWVETWTKTCVTLAVCHFHVSWWEGFAHSETNLQARSEAQLSEESAAQLRSKLTESGSASRLGEGGWGEGGGLGGVRGVGEEFFHSQRPPNPRGPVLGGAC